MQYVRRVTDTPAAPRPPPATPSDPASDGAPTSRPQTEVDRIAERYFDAAVALSPINATYLGVPGGEEDLDDLSPAGNAAASRSCAATPSRSSRAPRPPTTSTG